MSEKLAARLIIPLAIVGEASIFVFHLYALGWSIFALAAIVTALQRDPLRRHLLLVLASLAILALAPISTNLTTGHILVMASMFVFAAALPYIILRRVFHDPAITFSFHHGRNWYRTEIFYILTWGAIAYLFMPFYFRTTGDYHFWTVTLDFRNLAVLFLACLAMGVWDEVFFVNTILGVFRRYLPFFWANLAQAVIFTTFLYELGFRGWAPLGLFPFTLLQGYIYMRTRSLIYVITIHLTIDVVLYLALIHAYYPKLMPIFLT
jgi:membrane protease YdiL (CAAX protease family)